MSRKDAVRQAVLDQGQELAEDEKANFRNGNCDT
jgi:hypothetical protein